MNMALSTWCSFLFDCMLLSCHVRISEWTHTLYLPECKGTLCSKQTRYLKFKWLQRDSNPQPLRVPLQSLSFLFLLHFFKKVVNYQNLIRMTIVWSSIFVFHYPNKIIMSHLDIKIISNKRKKLSSSVLQYTGI